MSVSLSLPQSTATPISVLETSGYSVKVHTFDDAPNFMNERERERAGGSEREKERVATNNNNELLFYTYVRPLLQDFSLGLSCVVSDELGRRTTDFPGSLVQTTEGSLYQKCPSYTSICHRATYCLGVDVWTICFLQRQLRRSRASYSCWDRLTTFNPMRLLFLFEQNLVWWWCGLVLIF